MEVRFFDFEKDYAMVTEWYLGWGYNPIPPEILPRHGMIVSNHGHDVGAVWLYVTDGKVGLLEGAVIDPKAPKDRRKGTAAFLNEAMQAVARHVGCIELWVISKDRFLTKLCKELGFGCLEKEFNVLTKRL